MAVVDTFAGKAPALLTIPATNGETVSPSDTVNLTSVSRGIWVGVGGNVAAVMLDGAVLTFVGVAAGTLLPIRCSRINNTNTTATTMVSIY